MAPRIAYTQPQAGPQGFARTKKVYGGTVNLLATDLVTTAQTAVCRVPAGFVLQSVFASSSDMDTNGSPTLAFNLGDSGSAARIFSVEYRPGRHLDNHSGCCRFVLPVPD
jgi:hypothetical protein